MRWALVLVVAACGDNAVPRGAFEVVGHTDLGARGMNSALAIAGDIAYVGSRIDGKPVLIVDIKDPANPQVIGQIGRPIEGVSGVSSRELRASTEPPLLYILNLWCDPVLHGCSSGAEEPENIKQFSIVDPKAPQLLGTHFIEQPRLKRRDPHEFFLWHDPIDKTRVLVFLTVPGPSPQLEILKATPGDPELIVSYDPLSQGGVTSAPANDILHSVSSSDDGRTLYFSHQTGGLYAADISTVIDQAEVPGVSMITAAADAPKFGVMGPHSAVPVPGRKLLVTTEEVYPPPNGAGCPWGWLRMVDIANPATPKLAGEYKLPENDAGCAADAPLTTFTSHNPTVTEHVALVTWYAGGLQAVDISDPSAPFQLAEFRPDPLPQVAVEDPGLGGNKVEMWSYPIIKDGLIYVVDVRNGLYVLRYNGYGADEIKRRRFLEGNSNLGAYLARE